MHTVYFVSLGCPGNRVDTEVMLGHLQHEGYRAVAAPHEAELIVVNTCGFIDAANEESVDAILEMATYKTVGRCRSLVVAGCLSQRYAPQLQQEIPEVDHFLGTGDVDRIAQVVSGAPATEQVWVANDDLVAHGRARLPMATPSVVESSAPSPSPRLPVADAPRPYPHATTRQFTNVCAPAFTLTSASPRQRTQPAWSTSLKVSEGCSNRCAFCVVPKLRGPQVSRSMADVLEEARRLVGEGVVELNLLAQDLCNYGRDLSPKQSLSDLLAALDKLGDEAGRRLWIRCLYAYPRGLSAATIDVLAGARHIVPYLDLPLQHIADRLLRRMRRGVTECSTRELIATLRRRVPDLTLRTTLIAGLPSESEDEFAALCDFVIETRFERLSVYAYSQQDDTPAGCMAKQVAPAVREQRRRHLLRQQRTISRQQQRALRGKSLEVLVAGVSEETDLLLVGRHAGQAPQIDGITYITGGTAAAGQLISICVEQAYDYDVAGEMVQLC